MRFPMMLTHHRHHAICIYADVEKEGRELFKYREVARGAEFVYECLQLYTKNACATSMHVYHQLQPSYFKGAKN